MADCESGGSEHSSFDDEECDSSIDLEDFSDGSEYPDPEESSIGIQPYAFEPEFTEEELRAMEEQDFVEGDQETPNDRQSDLSWCGCGNCEIMPTTQECVCCQENNKMINKLEEVKEEIMPSCITLHPGFRTVCLDVWVLQAAYLAYQQRYGHYVAPVHEQYRYTAYRQLVRWCCGYLGRRHRITLPACAVALIRKTFPSESYTGFHFPRLEE